MTLEIFLIDFENVQPAGLGRLKPGECLIKVFLGQSQTKLPLDLSRALQPFGTSVEYVAISGNGPNAVDFHIAYYLGRLADTHRGAHFTIVSRDKGFDPLIAHVCAQKIPCNRLEALPGTAPAAAAKAVAKKKASVAKPTPAKTAPAKTAAKKATPGNGRAKNVQITVLPASGGKAGFAKPATDLDGIITRLKGLKSAKPATLKTLQSSLASWHKPALDGNGVASVVKQLIDRELIRINGTKVTYTLS